MRLPVSRFAPLLAAAAAVSLGSFAFAQSSVAGPEGDYPRVLGDPFVIDGVTYTPADTMNYDQVGYAAMRADGSGVSGSHRTLPLPSYVEVTALDSGRTILVRLDQRGPISGPDLVDLSPAAWAQLGLPQGAAVAVRVRRVNPPETERALLREGATAPERMETPKGLLAVLVRKLPPAPPGALKPGIEPAPLATSPVLAPGTVAKVAEKPAATPAPAPTVRQDPAAVAAAPAVKDAPKPAAKVVAAPPRPAAAAKPAPAAGGPGWFVQAAAFSSKERADAAARALGGTVSATGKLWRVRVGPLASTAAADAALAKVRAAGYAGARVVRAP
jgi:rare lipoprotein A